MPHVIIHFEIPADDIHRAKRFYEQLFGWSFQDRPPLPGEGAAYMLIETGGKPNGGLMGRTMIGQGILTYFAVEDIDGYTAKAVSLGGTVRAARRAVPGLGWWTVIEDPEGNVLALWQDDHMAA
jgi:predicted enzyme related to lactoylglutathione lyase